VAAGRALTGDQEVPMNVARQGLPPALEHPPKPHLAPQPPGVRSSMNASPWARTISASSMPPSANTLLPSRDVHSSGEEDGKRLRHHSFATDPLAGRQLRHRRHRGIRLKLSRQKDVGCVATEGEEPFPWQRPSRVACCEAAPFNVAPAERRRGAGCAGKATAPAGWFGVFRRSDSHTGA
jgi:hypothetical protein